MLPPMNLDFFFFHLSYFFFKVFLDFFFFVLKQGRHSVHVVVRGRLAGCWFSPPVGFKYQTRVIRLGD